MKIGSAIVFKMKKNQLMKYWQLCTRAIIYTMNGKCVDFHISEQQAFVACKI